MLNLEKIEKIFFEDIIEEAKQGEDLIPDENGKDCLVFNVGFHACIEGRLNSGSFGDSKPVLMIQNKQQLLPLLKQYVDELDKKKFRTYSKFFLIFQSIISLIITIVALCFVNYDYGFIFTFIGISLIFSNIITYYQYISQITGRFNELSIVNIVKDIDYTKIQRIVYCWNLYSIL